MANALYPIYKQNLGAELHNMTVDDIRATLHDLGDVANSAARAFYNDCSSGTVAISSALTSPTFTLGVFDTADFSWTAVSGDQAEAVQLVNYNGAGAATDAARMLIGFWDTGITGMPITPNGGNINVTIHASGWFAL
jgi:hypothetical protein